MSATPRRAVAVVGTAQTDYRRVEDRNFPDMIREAAEGALADARISRNEVEAVVFGSAPEFFVGVHHPEHWCADAAGAVGKPFFRVHTGGTVGLSTAVAAYTLAASGLYSTVLAVCGDKPNEGPVQASLSAVAFPLYHRKFAAGAVGGAGLGFREVMSKTGITLEDAAYVAVKARRQAALNPHAHLRRADLTMEEVMASRPISEPLRLLDACPTSDGAAAMVFAAGGAAERSAAPPAWVHAAVACSEGPNDPERDHVVEPLALKEAIRRAYARAGVTDPRREIQVAEMYDPFSFQEILFAEALGFCPRGEGPRYVRSGATAIGGATPINPSGGVLSANTIGCSAMARGVEAVLQVQGRAGPRQVAGVERALAHGWGGAFQFHVVMIFGRAKPETAAARKAA